MITSIVTQTVLPDEVVIVDDGGGDLYSTTLAGDIPVVVARNPCNLGVVSSLNIGVAKSKNDLVLLGCADDVLLPVCIEECLKAWEKYKYDLGYYYLGVKYSTGQEQNTACGAAMITKALWKYTGGFPPQCAVGAADHIFLSALIAGSRDGYSDARIIRVSDTLTYWYRQHEGTETRRNIWPAIDAVRDWFTVNWRPNVS